jgi:hypothetical protein
MIFMDDLLHTGLARHTADVTGLDPATVKLRFAMFAFAMRVPAWAARRAISFPLRDTQVLSFLRLR